MMQMRAGDFAARVRRWAALALALSVLAACGRADLYSAVPEQEANEMIAILLEAGIDADKQAGKDGMVGIAVDKGDMARAVELLKNRGYPRGSFSSMGEIFKKDGLISSPLEERVRFIYALSQELSDTISHIDGVISARVHVVLPENVGRNEKLIPSSAAAFIKYRDDYDFSTLVPQIKQLVSNSISDLTYENVSVILVPSKVVAAQPPAAASEMAEVLSIGVARESLPRFWALVGGLAGMLILALVVAGMQFLRARQQRTGDGVPTSLPAPAGGGHGD